MRLKIKKIAIKLTPNNLFLLLALLLTTTAFISASLLDYLSFREKNFHYLPWPKPGPPITVNQKAPEFNLSQFLSQKLEEEGLPQENFSEEKTEDGLVHFSIKTKLSEYQKLKEKLFPALKKEKIKIKLSQQKTESGEILVSAELHHKGKFSGWLIFHLAPETLAANVPPIAPPAAVSQKKKPLPEAAVVIDDMGEDLNFIQELINLKVPLTIAILPESSHAQETAELAAKNGLEIIIHLPLEALNSQITSTGAEGLIRTSMNREEILSILEKDLSLVPYAKGLNNHMGSKATADDHLMEIIISFLKDKNLYFLDSKTSPKSIAYDLALKKKVPAASRQIFLDADEDRSRIKDRLFELFSYARKNGQAVAIGHPFPETLEALRQYLPRVSEYGLQLVTVSAVLKH
ncbi:MAG: divergent polysaccharide deacetylase family protein [Candidatus Saccharicenans sp.]|nr:MAG: hypothetical protein C0168_08960 [Candidatus Aminicenantes bacterium]HEK85244.1 divergent polysaccharide deacetylase family protein [Candidatus Aminicenantes bacterium]